MDSEIIPQLYLKIAEKYFEKEYLPVINVHLQTKNCS